MTERVVLTPETIQAVRDRDCERSGHAFKIALTGGVPSAVLCKRCGRSWLVDQRSARKRPKPKGVAT